MDDSQVSPKRGADGLTKYQRYYKNHPEAREKNVERARLRREEERKKKALESPAQSSRASTPRLPSDFRATKRNNQWAMYGEAVNSMIGPCPPEPLPDPDSFVEMDKLTPLTIQIFDWAEGWGGVTFWAIGIERSFQLAVEDERVEEWRVQLENHAEVGRQLLRGLHDMDGRLPLETYKVKQLWRLKCGLIEVLVKGLTILDIKTSLLPDLCAVNESRTTARMVMEPVNKEEEVSEHHDGIDSDTGGGDQDIYSS
ncbi:hypothetical protein FPV67DRAFT_1667913 [Lyophyllum atratum]|nr:hypothetical protein FPV67DRAFT_1667913 [Lyophyllum atratum]